MFDAVIVVLRWPLLPAAPEQLEQEQEDVEDVEEDAGSYGDGAVGTCSAQPVEVEDRERAEDAESCDGVDDVPVWGSRRRSRLLADRSSSRWACDHELGGTEWVGTWPTRSPVEGRHAHTLKDA